MVEERQWPEQDEWGRWKTYTKSFEAQEEGGRREIARRG